MQIGSDEDSKDKAWFLFRSVFGAILLCSIVSNLAVFLVWRTASTFIGRLAYVWYVGAAVWVLALFAMLYYALQRRFTQAKGILAAVVLGLLTLGASCAMNLAAVPAF